MGTSFPRNMDQVERVGKEKLLLSGLVQIEWKDRWMREEHLSPPHSSYIALPFALPFNLEHYGMTNCHLLRWTLNPKREEDGF